MINARPDSRVGKKLGLDWLDFSNTENNKREKMGIFFEQQIKPRKVR